MNTVHTEVADKEFSVNSSAVEQLVNAILSDHGIVESEITVIFGSDTLLHDLKWRFFEKDELTDVIAFRLDEQGEEMFEGEIYISIERASENAETYGVSLANELIRLICHGSLHLLGYTDDTPEKGTVMRQLEDPFQSAISENDLFRPSDPRSETNRDA